MLAWPPIDFWVTLAVGACVIYILDALFSGDE
jgi:hypothetical protein